MVSDKAKQTIEGMENGRYANNREISLGGVSYTARDVLIKAPLIARLNVYFVGGTGRGKTQLGHDLLSYFGDSSCYAMGRPDFEPSELLKQVRLGNLKDVKTDKELVELTENVRKQLFFIDELNRAPPIVQNYFFDFFDGKLVHDGKIFNLGTDGYSIGFATGNLGDGEYVGVSDSDRALKDRMHMIVKLDHPDYRPTPQNLLGVFRGKKNPRSDMPSQSKEVTKEDILALHKEFGDREIHPILPVLGVYFSEGLDYLENVKGNSKIKCDARWPNLEGIRTDIDENKVFPFSPRGVLSAIGLTGALAMIAEAKGKQPNTTNLFLDALRLTSPYSGVISPTYIDQEHSGDVYSAFDTLFGANSLNRRQIGEKVSKLEEAVALAEIGVTDSDLLQDIAPIEGRWTAVKQAIQDYAQANKDDPNPEKIKLRDIVARARREQGGK